MHALFFGLRKRIKPGIRVYILNTLRCNYDCEYCSNQFYNGKLIEVHDEIDADNWIEKIKSFPVKVNEVVISGGEPMLRNDFADLVNGLVLSGYFVTVQSNISVVKRAAELKKSSRLRISATWHPSMVGAGEFLYFLKHFKGFRVDVTCPEKNNGEIKIHNKTRVYAPSESDEYCLGVNRFVFAPNGMLFCSFNAMHKVLNENRFDFKKLERLEDISKRYNAEMETGC